MFIIFGTLHINHMNLILIFVAERELVSQPRNATFAINLCRRFFFWTGRLLIRCHLSMIRWYKMQHQKMNDVGMHPIFVVPGLSPSLLCWNMLSVFSLFWVREYVYLCACRCYWRKMMQVNRRLTIYCSEIMKHNSGT